MGLMAVLNKDGANSGCVMGRLAVGEKTDRGFPRSLDYFKPVATAEYVAAFKAAYGEKPTVVEVMFTPNEEDVNEYFVCLDNKGKLLRKTNSITDFALALDWHGDPDFFEFAQNGLPFCPFVHPKNGGLYVYQNGKAYKKNEDSWEEAGNMNADMLKTLTYVTWRRHLELRLFLPRIEGIYGLWIFEAKGITSIEPLRNSIQACRAMFNQNFSKTPFDMQVKIQEGSGGKRYPVVTIVPNFNKINELLQTSLVRLAAPQPQQLVLTEPFEPEYEIS